MIGRVLKNLYSIESKLGEGGPSIVFAGRDRLMDMPVAIKMLKDDPETGFVRPERFLREARTQAQLVHQNIVAIRAIIEELDRFFIVMEYVDGLDLAERIAASTDRPTLPLSQVYSIFEQVLEGLGYAHQSGVIHRDIKPSNLMVTSQGIVKIADFGIARSGTDHRITRTGAVVGSPMYMSPEQCRGLELDIRSDVYSVGISLFETLCGVPPFPLDKTEPPDLFELMRCHIMEMPPSLKSMGVDVSPLLEDVLRKSVSKSPDERFSSCESFVQALRATWDSEWVVQTRPNQDKQQDISSPIEEPHTEDVSTPLTPNNQNEQPLHSAKASFLQSRVWFLLVLGVVLFIGSGLYLFSTSQTKSRSAEHHSKPRMRHTQKTSQRQVLVRPKLSDTANKEMADVRHPSMRTVLQQLSPRVAKEKRPQPVSTSKHSTRSGPSIRKNKLRQRRVLSIRAVPRQVRLTSKRKAHFKKHKVHPVKKQKTVVAVHVRNTPPRGFPRKQMVFVSAGCFIQGASKPYLRYKKHDYGPERKVCIRRFWIDRFEVTAKAYKKCIRAKVCKDFRTRGALAASKQNDNEPIRGVSWYAARRFCRWAGKRLPTEAEWEKAARGRASRTYPWGMNLPTCRHAQFNKCFMHSMHVGPRSRRAGKSMYGAYDMAGNVAEWVQDCYATDAYRRLPMNNPIFFKKACSRHVVRGGSWNVPARALASFIRASLRRPVATVGFRCAWGSTQFQTQRHNP